MEFENLADLTEHVRAVVRDEDAGTAFTVLRQSHHVFGGDIGGKRVVVKVFSSQTALNHNGNGTRS